MPPKDVENSNTYFSFENGEYHKLGSLIPSIEMPDTKEICEEPININRNNEVRFIMSDLKSADGLTTNDLWLILSGVCTYEQITSNNWRRLHSLPMKHRRRA